MLCGGLGCLSRYILSGWVYKILGEQFPYGTLTTNIIGSFLLGLCMEFSLHSALIPMNLRIGITVGFLGGFTTFSTFSYETFKLLEHGEILHAIVNAMVSVLVCLMFSWLGISLARLL
jgi:CrcB protein